MAFPNSEIDCYELLIYNLDKLSLSALSSAKENPKDFILCLLPFTKHFLNSISNYIYLIVKLTIFHKILSPTFSSLV